MARANMVRQGFRYAPDLTGGVTVGPIQAAVASTYGTALYPGDPIIQVSDGTVARAAAGGGATILGVVSAIKQYTIAGVTQKFGDYLPATTPTWTAWSQRSIVEYIPCMDGVLFIAPCDDATTFTTLAGLQDAVYENADHAYGTADTSLGISPTVLDISTNATTNTLQWKIIDIFHSPGSDPAGGAYYEVIVKCNLPQWNLILGV